MNKYLFIVVLGLPSLSHAGLLDFEFLDRFREDPTSIVIQRAFDQNGVYLANPINLTIQRGDRIRFTKFEGQALKLLTLANLNARRAETIRGVGYFDERGTDVQWDEQAKAQRAQAWQMARRFDVIAGQDVPLLRLKRWLETFKRYTTPHDGVAYMREYFVPIAVLTEPMDVALEPTSSCGGRLEAQDMLAREREILQNPRPSK